MHNTVYHYTSPDGILGILKNKTLRFTDCQYLNDKGELLYIREPFERAWRKINAERGDSDDNIEQVIKNFFLLPYEHLSLQTYKNTSSGKKHLGFKRYRYYVLCASLHHDAANMWNYYVKNGVYQGYNLGINRNYIKEWFSTYHSEQIELLEGKIIYNKVIQEKMIYEKLKELSIQYDEVEKQIHNAKPHEFHDINIGDFQDKLYNYIHAQKLFFKNPAFSSEAEYRFVLKVDNEFFTQKDSSDNKFLRLDFRVGASGIITPFIEWAFKLSDKERLFNQITLAPMMEADLAEESFKRFLAITVQQRIEIKKSSINLRF